MLYSISTFLKALHFVITVYLHLRATLLSNSFSWTPAPSRLHHANYKQIIYSSADHDQMAFYIPKEINLGSTMLNCYQYY